MGNYIKVLEAAEATSKKMTTHAEADAEVAALKERYKKVKTVSEEWVKKVDTLMKEWVLLDNTVTELNSWVAKDKTSEGENQFSLEKMESTLGELKNIFKAKEKLVRPVIVTISNNIRLFLYALDRTTDCNSSKREKLKLMMIGYLFSVVAIQVSIDSYVALVMTW